MNPILIDTSVYAAFKRGRPEAIAIVQRAPAIVVGSVVSYDKHFRAMADLQVGISLAKLENS